MAVPEAVLIARARRAYEWGLVRSAMPAVAAVAPMAAVSVVMCREYAATSASAAALACVLMAASWRGRRFARGARAGLVAGLAPLLLPLATCVHVCTGGRCLLAPILCVAAGLLGGAAVGLRPRGAAAAVLPAGDMRTALAVAALTGSMGCLVAGASGLLGMAAGMAVGATVPVLWWRTRDA